jgi:hypothetical protein
LERAACAPREAKTYRRARNVGQAKAGQASHDSRHRKEDVAMCFFKSRSWVAFAVGNIWAAAANAGGVIYVDAGAPPGGDGSSWAAAFSDLQDALAAASVGNEIWVAQGTYLPTPDQDREVSFVLRNGLALYGGFDGTEAARDQRDWIANPTVLSGDLQSNDGPDFQQYFDNSLHVVVGSDTNGSAILDGFVVTAGNASGLIGTDWSRGGGMHNFDGSPTVANCTFLRNRATLFGGGMYNEFGDPTVVNCEFVKNTGLGGGNGGGMYNMDTAGPTLINCSFLHNTAVEQGGGLTNLWALDCVLVNCTFEGNNTLEGGGGWGADCATCAATQRWSTASLLGTEPLATA